MTIQILPARLANQIAAGEVVERPSSVVKELVENSLDSGASRIDIDIEKGGAKLIRVRDNGHGIEKEELGLALSRHATSKIHTLDDLEAIMSLGFRGEALASISSVSRLTLTSRTATQEEAWSAYSEGRDMNVKLTPAAHPIGTTVEVLDLFFNTPARRKFLRTEKTEFNHIDELLKRIALSRFDVSLTLRHNGKVVRQYRAANNEIQIEKRIGAVCGSAFVREMLKIEVEHEGLKLSGWITTPEGARQQSDLQFCYVNGRMMRDKLINHAIRQSYENSLRPDQFAAYVLFIELDPHQVDVNVHPAKHEVRFHQARLVHDFIYKALSDALVQSQTIHAPAIKASAYHQPLDSAPSIENQEAEKPSNIVPESVYQAVKNSPAYPGRADYQSSNESIGSRQDSRRDWTGSSSSLKGRGQDRPTGVSRQEQQAYQALLSTPEQEDNLHSRNNDIADHQLTSYQVEGSVEALGKAITVVQRQYLVMGSKGSCVLVSLSRAEWLRVRGQLDAKTQPLKSQPLLIPLSLSVTESERLHLEQYQELYRQLGIEYQIRNKNIVMIQGMAQPLRQQNLQLLLPDLLSYVTQWIDQDMDSSISFDRIAIWLADRTAQVKESYTLSAAIQLIAEVEQLWAGHLPLDDTQFVRTIDFSATISALSAG